MQTKLLSNKAITLKKHKKKNSHEFSSSGLTSSGFSLLEVLIVMGIMAAISAVIIPNMGLTQGSQAAISIREIASHVRATYDNAVFSGRLQRMVICPAEGTYWTESAPIGYQGRAPAPEDTSAKAGFNADARARLIEELAKASEQPRKSSIDDKKSYTFRSPIMLHSSFLKPPKWNEVDDATLSKHVLPGEMAFKSIYVNTKPEPLELANTSENICEFIYFFPSGEVQPSAIQIGSLKAKKEINENGPKFSLFIDSLSGKIGVVDGFQEPEFTGEFK
jgi:prepilin-type N-terminal cleavage/methylation domain-containing protein